MAVDADRLRPLSRRQREFFIDNLLVRIYFSIVMIRWTGLAPWAVEFPFPGSLTSTFRAGRFFRELLLLSSLELSDTNVYEA